MRRELVIRAVLVLIVLVACVFMVIVWRVDSAAEEGASAELTHQTHSPAVSTSSSSHAAAAGQVVGSQAGHSGGAADVSGVTAPDDAGSGANTTSTPVEQRHDGSSAIADARGTSGRAADDDDASHSTGGSLGSNDVPPVEQMKCPGFAGGRFELQPIVVNARAGSACWMYQYPTFLLPSVTHNSTSCNASEVDFAGGPPHGCRMSISDILLYSNVSCTGIYCAFSMVINEFTYNPSSLYVLNTTRYHATKPDGTAYSAAERKDAKYRYQPDKSFSFGDTFVRARSKEQMEALAAKSRHWPGTTFAVFYHYPFIHNPFHWQQGFWRAYYLLVGHCLKPDRVVFIYGSNVFPLGLGMWNTLVVDYEHFCGPMPPVVNEAEMRKTTNLFASLMFADYHDSMPWPYYVHKPALQFGAARARLSVGVPAAGFEGREHTVLWLDRKGNRQVMNPEAFAATVRSTLGPGWNLQHVFMSDLTFQQQLQAVANASVIIGVHGAHYAMMNFALPGAMVFEIMPFLWKDSVYAKTVPAAGLHYFQCRMPTAQTVVNKPGQTEAEWQKGLSYLSNKYLPPGMSLYNLTWNSPAFSSSRMSALEYTGMSQWIIVFSAVMVNTTFVAQQLAAAVATWKGAQGLAEPLT